MNAARQAWLKARSAERKAENHSTHHEQSPAAWQLWASGMTLFRSILAEVDNAQNAIPQIANSTLGESSNQ